MSEIPFVGCRHIALRFTLLGGVCALASCSNPFGPAPGDYGRVVPVERLRTIATLSLDDTIAERLADEEPALSDEELKEGVPNPFEGYDTLEISIEQCRAWALENNLDLQVALIDPTIANEQLSGEEAKFEATFTSDVRFQKINEPTASTLSNNEADFLSFTPGVTIPLRTGGTVTVNLPFNRTQTNNVFSTLNPSFTSDAQFSISQPLLRNAGRRANTHSIRIQALESQIADAQTKLEVIRQLADVDRAYWFLYAVQRQLEVAQEQYELAVEQLERAERRIRAQVIAEVEVVRAQDGVASRLEDIIIAQNNVSLRQRNLKRLINVDGLDIGSKISFVLTSQPDPVRFTLDSQELASAAIANRMEMLEFELRIAQDYSTIDFEKNQALPNFVLDYQYAPQGLGSSYTDSLKLLKRNSFTNWQIGANIQIPLGNEAAKSRVHVAILRRLQRLASKASRALSIRQEVFDAIDDLNAGWQRILASRQATILAARTLQAEQNQFDVGVRTSTDVLDAATRLADAQTSEIVALTNYQISQVDLAFATGTLLGQAKVDWEPRDPRTSKDFAGQQRESVQLSPPDVPVPDEN